ncbi:hypothetical protein F4777DRAFT_579029 [Nemania sp. FL0916]|nr:hypothetical protein F4777DRAFT_579029 [Nemania sp. FL0916]
MVIDTNRQALSGHVLAFNHDLTSHDSAPRPAYASFPESRAKNCSFLPAGFIAASIMALCIQKEELVESTPRVNADVSEVRTWVLEVFHRRCHPDPEGALDGFYWKGRDLHSQRRYIALRLRFRLEPFGYLIAHDIHDAVKASGLLSQALNLTDKFLTSESRERDRKREKTAKRQAKTTSRTIIEPQLSFAEIGRNQDAEPKRMKAKKKLGRIIGTSRGISSETTTAAASPTGVGDPFRDPVPTFKKPKMKTKKRKRKKEAAASPDSVEGAQDPFQDPEPMHLIDADDYRLDQASSTD